MSKNTKRSHQNTNAADKGRPAVNSRGAFVKSGIIIGILLFALVGFGALATRRNSTENNVSESGPTASLLPSGTPQYAANAPAKEYIYAGGKLLAVSDPVPPTPADLAVWRPANGTWYVLGGPGSAETYQPFGLNGDIPVPGDFDGDGKTDFSIFRPSDSNWYVYSSGGVFSQVRFGLSGDIPAPADFDGDGKTDLAVFRPSNGYWYILRSGNQGYSEGQFGITGDVPAPADYDGDGKADLAVWRSSDSKFYSLRSSNGAYEETPMNQTGTPVPGDYDGDGRSDFALFNSSTANWYIRQSTTATITTTQWGNASDTPVQNDYDGDGKVDIAVWRNSNANWYIRQSASNNSLRQVQWGISGDIPVPAFYRR